PQQQRCTATRRESVSGWSRAHRTRGARTPRGSSAATRWGGFRPCLANGTDWFCFPGGTDRACKPVQREEIFAIVLHRAFGTQRLGSANPPAVQNQRIRRPGPSRLRKFSAELLFDGFRIVAFGDANPVGDSKHVPIDRKPWDAERVAEHDVRGLSSDTGQID